MDREADSGSSGRSIYQVNSVRRDLSTNVLTLCGEVRPNVGGGVV
jgi:hypothetical protein